MLSISGTWIPETETRFNGLLYLYLHCVDMVRVAVLLAMFAVAYLISSSTMHGGLSWYVRSIMLRARPNQAGTVAAALSHSPVYSIETA